MSTSMYTKDGLVLEIEYAKKAVENSYTIIGVRGKDAAVLAVDKTIESSLYEPDADGRIFTVETNIGMAIAGFSPDGRVIAEFARQQAAHYRLRHSVAIPIKELKDRVACYMHSCTVYSVVRPFGVCVILASWDAVYGPQLYKIDPSGAFYGCYSCASGKTESEAMAEIARQNLTGMSTKNLVKSAGRIIYRSHDMFEPKDFIFEMGIVGQATKGMHVINPTELTYMARQAGLMAVIEDDSDEFL